ncbi:MAG: hypothetical protein AAF456_24205 [Planctomycetota bacterium]
MAGLIWLIQIVHYPLFDLVGTDHYAEYQQRHQLLITPIVGPVMLVELLTGFLLVLQADRSIPRWILNTAFGLLILIWASTAFIQVPCHESLSNAFDPDVHDWLVISNWIRIVGWSLRGILMTYALLIVLNTRSRETVTGQPPS